uniref:F-box/LRR-repeat protein 15/At3g58940/PEG3-like LRR domain-containing protein n=1 Tax=Chenopodium quinoa TaxID=63459 RepID=A0A803MPR9_CHEQI
MASSESSKKIQVSMLAKTSVLSRKWRRNWLSLKYLIFNKAFWEEHKSSTYFDWKRINEIISGILLHHNGPVHEFYLHVPNDPDQEFYLNLSQWLSFLSRAAIKKITLVNLAKADSLPIMPSHIFSCNELVDLKIVYYALNAPPSDCLGFAYLQNLELLSVEFKHDVFRSLIASCPGLTQLKLKDCIGITNLITPNKSVLQHKFDYDNNFKLRHLLKAKITGITGSSAELKLVEYIVGISVKLTRFLFKCNNLDPSSELKVLRELLQLPRASKKAKLVCLAQ